MRPMSSMKKISIICRWYNYVQSFITSTRTTLLLIYFIILLGLLNSADGSTISTAGLVKNDNNHQVRGGRTDLSLLKRSSELLVMHRNGVYQFLTNFMNLVYRIYTSETNINRLNNLFQTFRTLLNSDGSVAVDRSSNTVGNLFGIYYAIVTGIEHAIARHKDKKEKKDGISEKHDADLDRNSGDEDFSRFSCHTKGHILMDDNKTAKMIHCRRDPQESD